MTIADFDKLMLALADQKENEGEELEVNSAIAFKGVAYVCLGNGGGRDHSTEFLKKKLPDFKIMEPFDKPEGWNQCQNYICSKNRLFLRQEILRYLETKQIPKYENDDDEEKKAHPVLQAFAFPPKRKRRNRRRRPESHREQCIRVAQNLLRKLGGDRCETRYGDRILVEGGRVVVHRKK